MGLQNKYTLWDDEIFKSQNYITADLIHMHILTPDFLKISTIKRISEEKPLIWTWHDPSYLTGHCIYPSRCANWEQNCLKCPDLERGFPVKRDRTFKNRRDKKKTFSQMDFKLHLASDWMFELVKNNIELRSQPVVIPLPSRFKIEERNRSRTDFRKEHGLSPIDYVIGFRDTNQFQKNIKILEDTLIGVKKNNVVLVSTDQKDTLHQFRNKFRVIELGHLEADDRLVNFYSGIDIFLNLSSDEAYGMMAAESTSLGTPVMAFRNTATYEIIEKYGGYPISNIQEAINILNNLIGNEENRNHNIVNKNILDQLSTFTFVSKMKKIYSDLIQENKNDK
jgi:glycosyltransferase involved in cell wall biosynthesis